MRMLKKNKQRMWYSLYVEDIPIYELDDEGNIIYDSYTDDECNTYTYPRETGEKITGYSAPVEFKGNISLSGGESEAVEYGVDLSQYAAILVTDKGLLPITETSLIWHTTAPVTNTDGTADEHSADYTVVKVNPSLNIDKYVLQKVVKQHG